MTGSKFKAGAKADPGRLDEHQIVFPSSSYPLPNHPYQGFGAPWHYSYSTTGMVSAAGQLADGLHFLGLKVLPFQLAPIFIELDAGQDTRNLIGHAPHQAHFIF